MGQLQTSNTKLQTEQTMRTAFFLFFIAFFVACKTNSTDGPRLEGDRQLAKVYDKTLWLSDMEGMFAQGMKTADSAAVIAAFVQNWSRQELMRFEADRDVTQDQTIDELVRDYRASLIRQLYEEQLFAEKLDTTVSEADMRRIFEADPTLFQLETNVLRCLLVKIPSPSPDESEFKKAWAAAAAGASSLLADYSKKHASISLTDATKWYALEEVAALLPKGTLSTANLQAGRELTVSDDEGGKFWVRVLEAAQSNSTMPFDYAKPRIRAIVLHKRRSDLLEKHQNELFETEKRRENVKIF